MTHPDDPNVQNAKLKDYFCPFCNHKLFRGNVNEFKLVCQECNRLVDSTTLKQETESPANDAQSSAESKT